MVCGGESVEGVDGDVEISFPVPTLNGSAARLSINTIGRLRPRELLPAPVDPVKLAKVVLGLETHYLPLSGDGSILGMACFQDTMLEVYDFDGNPFQVELTGRDIVIDCSFAGRWQTRTAQFYRRP